SDRMMAIAQIQSNESSFILNHTGWYLNQGVGENLAFTSSNRNYDPYDGWYYDEKNNFITGNGGQTGHYFNIIDRDTTSTGFAINQYGSTYGHTYGQEFGITGIGSNP